MTIKNLSRRRVLTAGAIGAVALGAPAIVRAAPREVTVGGPSGPQEGATRKWIIPAFEKQHNVKVNYDANLSLPNLAKLQASPKSPPFDVVMMDEAIILLAAKDGLLEPVTPTKVPNISKLVGDAVIRDGLWLTYMCPAISIAYNTRSMKDGVPSWLTLWDAKLRERVIIPHPKTTQAPCTIAMAAHFETGKPIKEAQYDLDAGFRKLKQMKPNLLQAYIASAEVTPLLEQGECWAAAGFFTSGTFPRKIAGAPIDLARPKEGSFAMPKSVAKVKNAAAPELADLFIDACLGPEFQAIFQRDLYGAPTNTTVPVDPQYIAAKDLLSIDWAFYSDKLKENSDRFDREIVG